MEHHFSVEVAVEYGIDVATFLNNLAFWTHKNSANKSHIKDGRCWIYNTQEAWTILFPYWTRQNIRTIVKKCSDNKLILVGNYNEKNYDKTCWYCLSDKALGFYPLVQKSLGWNQPRVVDNSQKPWLESTNGLVGINQPIPDNKPDNKHKSFCRSDEQKKANEKKPEWAEKPKAPLADVTKQSTSYNPDRPSHSEPSPLVKEYMERKKLNDSKKSTQLPTGTEIQSEIPTRNEPSVQGATIDAGGDEDMPPPVREAHRLLETGSARAYLETLGLADSAGGCELRMASG